MSFQQDMRFGYCQMCRSLNLDLIVKAVHFVAQNALKMRVTVSVILP